MRIWAVLAALVFVAACSISDVGPKPIAKSPVARCMNLGNALEAPRSEGEWGYAVRYEDLEFLKQAGFDTVRLPVRWSAHTKKRPPYTIKPELIERVQEIAGWTDELGLNLIVDVHHFGQFTQSTRHEPKLVAIWDQISKAFVDAPPSVIFEFLNEPHGAVKTEYMNTLNRKLLRRIRKRHPDRWVILTGAGWGNVEGLEAGEFDYDRRVILSFHEYSPFKFTHQGVYWKKRPPPTGRSWGTDEEIQEMKRRLDRAVAVSEELRMPLLLGEFGVYEGVPVLERANWTKHLRKAAEGRDIGWCYWDFVTSFKAYDRREGEWVGPIHDALLRD